jgi:hypothetical protein
MADFDTLVTLEIYSHLFVGQSATSLSITADVGSAQGGSPLTRSFNVISVCANAGDSVTLPAVFKAGTLIFIKNNGANSSDVFPASGDNCGAGANTAVALANGKGVAYIATVENSTWTPLVVGA